MLQTIILCSDSEAAQKRLWSQVPQKGAKVIACKYASLSPTLALHAKASLVISWSVACAELRWILALAEEANHPLLLLIRHSIKVQLDPNGYVLLPDDPSLLLSPWIERAKLVRENQSQLKGQIDVLSEQLENRDWLEKAKRLLIKKYQLDEEKAYQLLRESAMQQRQSITVVAKRLVIMMEAPN